MQLLEDCAQLTIFFFPPTVIVVDSLLLLTSGQLLHESHFLLLGLQVRSLLLIAALLQLLQLDIAILDKIGLLLNLIPKLLHLFVTLIHLPRLHLQLLYLLLQNRQVLLALGLLAGAYINVLLDSLDRDLQFAAQFGELVLFGLELLLKQMAASEVRLVIVDFDAHPARPAHFLLQSADHALPLAFDGLDLLYYLQQVLTTSSSFFF